VGATCPVLVDAAAQATTLLAQMATDAVLQVVYVYYPETTDPELNSALNALPSAKGSEATANAIWQASCTPDER
jgi:hypothetical protein